MLLYSRCRRACVLSGALLDSESLPCQVGGVLDPWHCKARPKARESARAANFGRISPGQVPKRSIGSPICDERRAQLVFRRSRRAHGAASTCQGRGGGRPQVVKPIYGQAVQTRVSRAWFSYS